MSERFILLPPGLQALAAMAAFDDETEDGLPDHKYHLGGVHVRQDGDTVVCEATDGRIAARYTANIGKRMDGQTRGQVIEEPTSFPNLESVIPTAPPVMVVRFDPKRLITLLEACQRCAGFSGDVTMELRGPETVMVFRAVNERRGREFVGLMMPRAPQSRESGHP